MEHRVGFNQYVGHAEYLDSMDKKRPDVLGINRIASREDVLVGKIDVVTRREIFTRLISDQQTPRPPHPCLGKDDDPLALLGLPSTSTASQAFPATLLWPNRAFGGIQLK